jgi:hypothetical protein
MSAQPRRSLAFRLAGLGVVLLVGSAATAEAQRGLRPVRQPTSTPRVALSAMVTYQWGGSLTTPRGRLRLEPSENYAGVLAFRVRSGATAELYYSYQPTLMTLDGGVGIQEEVAPMGVHYFQVGGRYEPARSNRLVPFLAASAGATLFDARRNAAGVDLGSDWAFAFRLVGGATAWLNQRIGVRAEGGLLLPWWWTSGGFLCGATGCYTTLGGTAIAQGTVGGGVTIAF